MEAQRASPAQGHTAVESEPGHTQSPNSLTPVFHTNANAVSTPLSQAWGLQATSRASGSRDQRKESPQAEGGEDADTSEVTRSPCTVLLLPRSDWQTGPPKPVWRAQIQEPNPLGQERAELSVPGLGPFNSNQLHTGRATTGPTARPSRGPRARGERKPGGRCRVFTGQCFSPTSLSPSTETRPVSEPKVPAVSSLEKHGHAMTGRG